MRLFKIVMGAVVVMCPLFACGKTLPVVKCVPPKTAHLCDAYGWPPGEDSNNPSSPCELVYSDYFCALDHQEAIDAVTAAVNKTLAKQDFAGFTIKLDCTDTHKSTIDPNQKANSEDHLIYTATTSDGMLCSGSVEIDVPSCDPNELSSTCLNCARQKCCTQLMACIGAAGSPGDSICTCVAQCEASGGMQQMCENGDPTIPGSGCGLNPITQNIEACMNVNCPVECAPPKPTPPHAGQKKQHAILGELVSNHNKLQE